MQPSDSYGNPDFKRHRTIDSDLSSLDSFLDVLGLGGGDLADNGLVIGVDGVEQLASGRVHKLVVDEALVRTLDLHVICLYNCLKEEKSNKLLV